MKVALTLSCLAAAFAPLACAPGDDTSTHSTTTTGGDDLPGTPIPADAQRPGDAAKGYDALINNGYVSCGVPYTAYKQVFPPAAEQLKLPGRNANNTDLAFNYTRFTTKDGVDVVSANCLQCHAGFIKGQLVVGLGDTQRDYTYADEGAQANLAQVFLSDPKEKAALSTFVDRLQAIGPYTETLTVGVNPADNLAAILFAHRDRETLAWSEDPLLDLPPTTVVPVDVPPWWRMAKKNAMFYVAGGRGDHARIEMTASTLCTDSVEEAKKIDAYFPDIAAFIASIEPPKFAGAVDAKLAETGKGIFESTCAKCHGTYGDSPSYPNLLIDLDDIGTDPTMVTGLTQFASVYVDWFNESFYGELAHLDPQHGYIAPPLDGIWATAPYLHNGSVPTIEALLDSSRRPQFWSRKFDASGVYDDSDYNDAALGWNVDVLDHGRDAEADIQKKIHLYDTTLPGYGNTGHVFGDGLSTEERTAVIEYLKTL